MAVFLQPTDTGCKNPAREARLGSVRLGSAIFDVTDHLERAAETKHLHILQRSICRYTKNPYCQASNRNERFVLD